MLLRDEQPMACDHLRDEPRALTVAALDRSTGRARRQAMGQGTAHGEKSALNAKPMLPGMNQGPLLIFPM
jgi:hypothetical protein